VTSSSAARLFQTVLWSLARALALTDCVIGYNYFSICVKFDISEIADVAVVLVLWPVLGAGRDRRYTDSTTDP